MAGTLSVMLLTVVFSAAGSPTTFNAALGKDASQSSQYQFDTNVYLTADKAVDGNTDPNLENCASTGHHDWNPWWKVDLGENYTVMSVLVTNRLLYSNRLRDFRVTVDGDDNRHSMVCGQYSGTVASAATATVTCAQVTWGRYVKITKPVSSAFDIFTPCEVQVMALDRTYMKFRREVSKTTTSDVTITMTTDHPTCAQACKTASDCLGINYNRVQRECQLLNSTHTEDTSVNNGWDFYVVVV